MKSLYTILGQLYDHELSKDARGCSICQNCQNNALASSGTTQAGVQLTARSLAQQNAVQPADLESAYKLYASNNAADDRMLKAEAIGAIVSSSANVSSSSNANNSSSSAHGKPRNKKPAVSSLKQSVN